MWVSNQQECYQILCASGVEKLIMSPYFWAVYMFLKLRQEWNLCWCFCCLKLKPPDTRKGHKGNTASKYILGQHLHTPACIINREALQIRQTPKRQAHTPTSWKYLRPLVCPLMKVTENTTRICLLRAFLFWLENESAEEIENKKCKSSLPLAQIRLAQAHTSAWQGSTHCLHF